MTDLAPQPPTPPLNVTALFAEAAAKSSVCWLRTPTGTYAVWHVWDRDAVLVVTGPGEQRLPELPVEIGIIVRSKDSGGRLLSIAAHAIPIPPSDPTWDAAASALAASRLNATDDQIARWREQGTIYALHPFGAPIEAPGSYREDSGVEPVIPARATTAGWRPKHLGGRARRRRRP